MLVLWTLACSDYVLQGEKDHEGTDLWGEESGAGENTLDSNPKEDPKDSSSQNMPPVPDGKVDVALLIDVAYVYSCYHAELPTRTQELTRALLNSGADVSIAIASFDDYNVDGEIFAKWGGLPYLLEQQLTDDQGLLDAAGGRLSLDWGGDGEGSGFEAIYQAVKGKGYDQDCDGRYDSSYDVKPFSDSSNDAFNGGVNGTEDASTPGTGDNPGVGFRNGSKRVVVLITENNIRDKAYGHKIPTGVCPGVASRSDAGEAMMNMDAKFLGINAYEFQDMDPTLQQQLEDMADRTNSRIDADNDGQYDDVAVLSGSWDWPPVQQTVQAIWDLAR
jgi:hypothetical protein